MAYEIFVQERHNCSHYRQRCHLPLPPSGLFHFLLFFFFIFIFLFLFLSPSRFRFVAILLSVIPSGYIPIWRNFSGLRSKFGAFYRSWVFIGSIHNNIISRLLIFRISFLVDYHFNSRFQYHLGSLFLDFLLLQ